MNWYQQRVSTELVSSIINFRKVRLISSLQQGRKFRGAYLGELWDLINFILSVLTIGTIFSLLFNKDFISYTIYLGFGLAYWNFISNSISEASSVFSRNAAMMKEIPLSPLVFINGLSYKHLKIFVISFSIIFLFKSFYLNFETNVIYLVSLVCSILVVYSLVIIFSIFGLFIRDISFLLVNIFRVLFFLTPIIWEPENRPGLIYLSNLNPISIMINSIRDTNFFSFNLTFIFFLILIFVIFLFSLVLYKLTRKKLIIYV